MKDLKIARHRYGVHKAGAKARKIAWNLTFENWYSWWIENGIDKNIPNSSLSGDQPCMCRNGDTGPYSLDNIYYATRRQNVAYSRENKKYVTRSGHGKSIKTPKGIFQSIASAALQFEVTPKTIRDRTKRQPQEYAYLN